jgi:hypothetical protein
LACLGRRIVEFRRDLAAGGAHDSVGPLPLELLGLNMVPLSDVAAVAGPGSLARAWPRFSNEAPVKRAA